jgi:pyruvate kinase
MKTKIVATIGPACKDRVSLEKMVEAGLNVARLNFSHGKKEEFEKWIKILREISKERQQPIAILQDLQGPRIRIGELEKKVKIKEKDTVILYITKNIPKTNEIKLPVKCKTLTEDVREKDRILIDNGKIELKVADIQKTYIKTTAVIGGEVISHKGINLPDTKISLPTITKKDEEDLKFGAEQGIDYIALSFVRSPADIDKARKQIEKQVNKDIDIIAKIETKQALKNIDGIIAKTDGIMIARGDLGIELDLEEVPIAQKKIIEKARQAGKPVVTATQMLSSMVENAHPTRAEVSDVANAIIDGTDGVMLSEESAIGKYPVEAVKTMAKVISKTEQEITCIQPDIKVGYHEGKLKKISDETKNVGISASSLAYRLGAKYIACATASGFTARMVSMHRPNTKIVAFTPNKRVYNKLALVWGVNRYILPGSHTTDELIYLISEKLKEKKKIKSGDYIVITAGHPVGKKGNTNLIKVEKI